MNELKIVVRESFAEAATVALGMGEQGYMPDCAIFAGEISTAIRARAEEITNG